MTTNSKTAFIDTSSCLQPNAVTILRCEIMPRLEKEGCRLVLAQKVVGELEKHEAGTDPVLRNTARDVLAYFSTLEGRPDFRLVGEPDDPVVDALFQALFIRFRTKFPQVLITQDVPLMADILDLANSRSVTRGVYPIEIWTIDERTGQLRSVERREVDARIAGRTRRAEPAAAKVDKKSDFQPYALTAAVTTATTRVPVTAPEPGEGATLHCGDGTSVILGKKLGRGGEGTVYDTDRAGLVAKVYSAKCLTREREQKLARMIEHGLDWSDPRCAGICWPTSLLRDRNSVFRGYLMPKAYGEPLANGVFIGRNLLRSFPDWDRTNLVHLCLEITRKIQFLHSANVLIGDINQNNILVAGDREVYLLDTDSYQVEMWPCPVGTVHFTPPELQGCRFKDLVRTKEHERFAVATLLFMVLHAGKPPYAQTGGEDPGQNIRNRKFSYPFKERKSQNVPAGPWRFIWSNLSLATKEAFFRSFDASHAKEPRVTLEEWIKVLEAYLYHLKNHDLGPGNIERQLFPNQNKPLSEHAVTRYGQKPRSRTTASARMSVTFNR